MIRCDSIRCVLLFRLLCMFDLYGLLLYASDHIDEGMQEPGLVCRGGLRLSSRMSGSMPFFYSAIVNACLAAPTIMVSA